MTYIFDVVHLFFQLIGRPPIHHHFFLLILIGPSHHAIDNTLRKFPGWFFIVWIRMLKGSRKREKNNDSLGLIKAAVTGPLYMVVQVVPSTGVPGSRERPAEIQPSLCSPSHTWHGESLPLSWGKSNFLQFLPKPCPPT